MVENIHWLGHDSFRIDGSRTVYVDPWKISRPTPSADVILVTHDHYDHLSPDDIAALAMSSTVVVGPVAVTEQLPDFQAMTVSPGDTVSAGGVTVTAVPAYNIDKFKAPDQVFHPRRQATSGSSSSWTGGASTTRVTPMRFLRCGTSSATWPFSLSAAPT